MKTFVIGTISSPASVEMERALRSEVVDDRTLADPDVALDSLAPEVEGSRT